jgi:hypothetical protein
MPEYDVNGDDVEDDYFEISDDYMSEEFRDIIGKPVDDEEVDPENSDSTYVEGDEINDQFNLGDLY